MIVASLTASSLAIPFLHRFRHAAADRAVSETLVVEATGPQGLRGYGEGCPRSYVTGEYLHSAAAFIAAHRGDWMTQVVDADTLAAWVMSHRALIDRNPAAWSAVELALLDLIGKLEGRSVEAVLGLPGLSGSFRYTAVLGDAPLQQFEAQLAQYVQAGFREYKIKLSGDAWRDRAKLRSLAGMGILPGCVRADANGLWPDSGMALRALAALDYPFFAIEEPLRPGDIQGLRRIASGLGLPVVMDESLLRIGQLDRLGEERDCWIANVRVSKMGGLLRSLELVRALRSRGMRVICGAHVGETSLLARAALTVASQARDFVVGMEGAFGTRLLTADVTDSPVMFGSEGLLDSTSLATGICGLGLRILRPLPHALPLAAVA
jgi:L-alanine-DL-glutamate epimerase-like enolase superfamily enzyme